MKQLRSLAKQLNNPGADKLYTAARKRGIAVTRNQIKQLLETKGAKQLFRPLRERARGGLGQRLPLRA